jgi:hypothetical protein
MAVFVDVLEQPGMPCRVAECQQEAVFFLQRPPVPNAYYCREDARRRVEDHRKWNHAVEVSDAARALLGVAS